MSFRIYNILADRFGKDTLLYFDDTLNPYIQVAPELIQTLCIFMRYNPALKFSFLFSLCGVDYPEKNQITMVYHLFSMKQKMLWVLKTSVRREHPELESIESVWKTAGWFEREIYDLLGVKFTNHSNMKRLLLPDGWVGHPLRKDYEEPLFYHDMETSRHRVS
ncbi:MAG: NADH-quinone oxidoreductase subunit C [Deltaproteobacteria bacterium]|nr:NADH-quinone oxidoreductase subunit C [Deltaproteobacteria bacterium]